MTTAPDPAGRNGTNRGTLGPGIHFNGVFLPWHRYATWTYETALIEECGYNGAQPYWDWSLDSPERNSSFEKSPIWDAEYGFGGNGVDGSVPAPPPGTLPANQTTGSCIVDGRFAKYRPALGPGYNLQVPDPHCIRRNWQVNRADGAGRWNVNIVPLLKMTDFTNFTLSFDRDASGQGGGAGIHSVGHSGTGGEMQNVWSSINDPLFFMHHANLDRIWSIWQNSRPQNLYAMSGPIYPNGTGSTTLDYLVEMSPFIAPTIPIRRVMDISNQNGQGVLCYQYSESESSQPFEPR